LRKLVQSSTIIFFALYRKPNGLIVRNASESHRGSSEKFLSISRHVSDIKASHKVRQTDVEPPLKKSSMTFDPLPGGSRQFDGFNVRHLRQGIFCKADSLDLDQQADLSNKPKTSSLDALKVKLEPFEKSESQTIGAHLLQKRVKR
jgi:hypothetical protein